VRRESVHEDEDGERPATQRIFQPTADEQAGDELEGR
jgi:hypothetical protein